ncbi:MAG TPA: class I SAM-dependent methyltransferase [Chthoniobacteraceae bacterium]|nr:class I SAM-dependent methyltransferase [Chthoniobacteraceae bacterium]
MSRSDESYGQRSLTWVDRFGVWLSQRAILRHLPKRDALSVLDIGCGYHATQLMSLKDRIKIGVGIDFAVATGLKSQPGFEWHEGAVEECLPKLSESTFDAILMISVLEHLADPEAALARVRKLLRPQGVLLINVPTWRGKWWLELSAFRLGLSPKVEMDDHKMYYDVRDLWPRLVAAGFKPSHIHLRYHKFGLNLFATATSDE